MERPRPQALTTAAVDNFAQLVPLYLLDALRRQKSGVVGLAKDFPVWGRADKVNDMSSCRHPSHHPNSVDEVSNH